MRPVGLTLAALLAAPAAVWAQLPPGPPPGAPGVPAGPPAGAPGVPAGGVPGVPTGGPPGGGLAPATQPDPKLDAHLAGWEQKMGGLINFRSDFEKTETDGVFGRERKKSTGSILCMKPNLARLRMDNVANRADYEAYICDGKAVYFYNGLAKEIVQYPIAPGAGSDNLMLDILSGMKADDAKRRFAITLFKEDPNYIYLDIKPVLGKDQQEFKQVRFALFGPGVPNKALAYLPAQVYMAKPNGDTEEWKFSNPQINIPGVGADKFKYEPVPGWPVKQAPPAGAAGPGPGAPGGPPAAPPGGPAAPKRP